MSHVDEVLERLRCRQRFDEIEEQPSVRRLIARVSPDERQPVPRAADHGLGLVAGEPAPSATGRAREWKLHEGSPPLRLGDAGDRRVDRGRGRERRDLPPVESHELRPFRAHDGDARRDGGERAGACAEQPADRLQASRRQERRPEALDDL